MGRGKRGRKIGRGRWRGGRGGKTLLRISQVASVGDRIQALVDSGSEHQKEFLNSGGWSLLHDWIVQSDSSTNTDLLNSILQLMLQLPSDSVLTMLQEGECPIIPVLESIVQEKVVVKIEEGEECRQEEELPEVGQETKKLCTDLLSQWGLLLDKKEEEKCEDMRSGSLEFTVNSNDGQKLVLQPTPGNVWWEMTLAGKTQMVRMEEHSLTTLLKGPSDSNCSETEKKASDNCSSTPQSSLCSLTTSALSEVASSENGEENEKEEGIITGSSRSSSNSNCPSSPEKSQALLRKKRKRRTREVIEREKALENRKHHKRERDLDTVIQKVKGRMKERAKQTKEVKPLQDGPVILFRKRKIGGEKVEDEASGAITNACGEATEEKREEDNTERRHKAKVFVSEKSRVDDLVKVMEKSTVPSYPQRIVARILPTPKQSPALGSCKPVTTKEAEVQTVPSTELALLAPSAFVQSSSARAETVTAPPVSIQTFSSLPKDIGLEIRSSFMISTTTAPPHVPPPLNTCRELVWVPPRPQPYTSPGILTLASTAPPLPETFHSAPTQMGGMLPPPPPASVIPPRVVQPSCSSMELVLADPRKCRELLNKPEQQKKKPDDDEVIILELQEPPAWILHKIWKKKRPSSSCSSSSKSRSTSSTKKNPKKAITEERELNILEIAATLKVNPSGAIPSDSPVEPRENDSRPSRSNEASVSRIPTKDIKRCTKVFNRSRRPWPEPKPEDDSMHPVRIIPCYHSLNGEKKSVKKREAPLVDLTSPEKKEDNGGKYKYTFVRLPTLPPLPAPVLPRRSRFSPAAPLLEILPPPGQPSPPPIFPPLPKEPPPVAPAPPPPPPPQETLPSSEELMPPPPAPICPSSPRRHRFNRGRALLPSPLILAPSPPGSPPPSPQPLFGSVRDPLWYDLVSPATMPRSPFSGQLCQQQQHNPWSVAWNAASNAMNPFFMNLNGPQLPGPSFWHF